MYWMFARKPQPEPWKGLLAGAAGGLGATIAMTAFQALWIYAERRWRDNGRASTSGEGLPRTEKASSEERPTEEEEAQAPVRAAEPLILGGSAAHLGFGTGVGAVYGAIAEFSPKVARGDGVPFGTGLMVVTHEGAVPAFGLARSPKQKPLSAHIDVFLAHAVYGFTLEQIRRAVRGAL